MKLNDLHSYIEQTNQTQFHGVEVENFDIEENYPFQKVTEIGLVAKINDKGVLEDDVIDTAIYAGLDNVHIIIEIPYDVGFDPEGLVKQAVGLSCDLSILPPDEVEISKSTSIAKEYCDRIMSVADYILDTKSGSYSFSSHLHPVYGFLTYMFSSRLNYYPEKITTDEYMDSRFTSNLPAEFIDDLKLSLEQRILEFYGGEEAFRNILNGFITGIYDHTSNIAEFVVDKNEKKEDLQESD